MIYFCKVPGSASTKTLESMEISPEGTKLAFLGSEGYVHVADGRSKQWIADLKMNCTSRAVTFLDEITCITSGYDADLYMWDLRYSHRPRCVSRFHHDDGTPTSALAAYIPRNMANVNNGSSVSQTITKFHCLADAYLNVATMSGVSSIFEGYVSDNNSTGGYYSFGENFSPKPLKTIMNLTTKITTARYHPSGQILAIASNEVRSLYAFWELEVNFDGFENRKKIKLNLFICRHVASSEIGHCNRLLFTKLKLLNSVTMVNIWL